MKKIILTGSCTWCLEAVFKRVKGVVEVLPGLYSIANYKFAFTPKDQLECIKVIYDEEKITIEQILDALYLTHNPTLVKWDMNDCFYPLCRPAIFYSDEEQKNAVISRIEKNKTVYEGEIQTKYDEMKESYFVLAKEKDLDYYEKNPKDGYCTSIIDPKLDRLKKEFKHIYSGK